MSKQIHDSPSSYQGICSRSDSRRNMRPALMDGKPVRNKPFLPSFPEAGVAETRALARFFTKSRGWTYGIGVNSGNPHRHYYGRDFEAAFAAFHNARYGIVTGSGTAALIIALKAVGVEPGDEVIFQPYTCWANVEAVLQLYAVPVFADIDPATYNVDPARVDEKITSRTRAIVAIHWAGRPCDLDALRRLAQRHELALIEDAALAHGASWRGRKVGALDDAGIFSFGCGKLIQCGEGGMVLTNNRRLADACFDLRNRGRDLKNDPYRIGWNSRLSEILAVVLLEQLKRYPAQCARRQQNAAYLTAGLQSLRGIEVMREDRRITAQSYCFFVFKLNAKEFGLPRDRLIEAMNAEHVPVGTGHPVPVYRQRFIANGGLHRYLSALRGYRPRRDYRPADYPETERAWRQEALYLPHNYLLGSRSDIDDILTAIEKTRLYASALRRLA